MKTIEKYLVLTLAFGALILFSSLSLKTDVECEELDDSSEIIITISGIRGNEGHIGIGAFKSSKEFDDEVTDKFFKFSKSNVVNGKMVVKFHIEPDMYGFSLLDDENGNYQMDYNMFGIPKEGFGFSNYYHEGFTKPKFDKFKMDLRPNSVEEIEIKIRYLY